MSVRHPGIVEWEDRLKGIFDTIDDFLEDKYAGQFALHPNRPERGETSNKEHDGLFNIGASFTPGFGSAKGRGYIVEIRIVTLEPIPGNIREDIHHDVIKLLEEGLGREFPDRTLLVEKDGEAFKIFGDLSI